MGGSMGSRIQAATADGNPTPKCLARPAALFRRSGRATSAPLRRGGHASASISTRGGRRATVSRPQHDQPGPPCPPASSPRPTATSARRGSGRRCRWRGRRSWGSARRPRSRPAHRSRQRQPTMTASRRSSPRSGGRGRFGDVPDMTPEEHQRRGDAADALFREIVRRATGNDRSADPAAALAQLRHRPATDRPPKPWTSRSGRSRRGSCGSPATAAARTAWSTRRTRRGAIVPLRDILTRMRHDGCGGRPGRVELLTGIEGASSRPVRRIVLIDGLT